MRKLTILLFLMLFLVACGGGADETTEQPTATTPAVAVEPSPTVFVPATLPPPVVEGSGTEATGGTAEGGDNAAAPEVAPELPIFPWPADRFGYGIQVHGIAGQGDLRGTVSAVDNQLGLDWIKVQLLWSVVHPDPTADQWFFYDGIINDTYDEGLNLMVSVVGAPAWSRAAGNENGPPDDYNQYYAFLNELLDRHPGKIQAIEVWNEQNLDREWSGGLNPAGYVQFLAGAYQTIKAKNPDIIVISGALSPTGVHDANRQTVMNDLIYLDEMLAAGLLQHTDCVGTHHNGYNLLPSTPWDQTGSDPNVASATFRGPFDNPHQSWSFFTTLDLYAQKVQAIDPNKKLCLTEFGYASSENMGGRPETFEYFDDNSEAEQAQYIVQAYQQMHDSGDVWLTFLFNFDFGNKADAATDDTVGYSIIRPDGVPRPAYGAIADMPKNP